MAKLGKEINFFYEIEYVVYFLGLLEKEDNHTIKK